MASFLRWCSSLGWQVDKFIACERSDLLPASGSNQLHGAPQSLHAEHQNVAIVQGPQAKDCAKALGQPLLPVARGMTMPLQLNEAEFAQQGNEAEFAQQGPGNELGNAVGLSILQLGHGELSSSGWRADRIIAR